MQRREMLAGTGTLGVAAIAGCAGLGGTTTLSNPQEVRAEDGETTLEFHTKDGSEVGSLTVQPGRRRYDGARGEQVAVDVAITHPDDTTITGLILSLRAPPSGAGPSAEVALTTPFGTPHPAVDLYHDPEGGGTILAIDDMAKSGDGNVVFQFLLSGLDESPSELAVDATVTLSSSGLLQETYTLEGLTLVPLPSGGE